jgi:hypothetical protein
VQSESEGVDWNTMGGEEGGEVSGGGGASEESNILEEESETNEEERLHSAGLGIEGSEQGATEDGNATQVPFFSIPLEKVVDKLLS